MVCERALAQLSGLENKTISLSGLAFWEREGCEAGTRDSGKSVTR